GRQHHPVARLFVEERRSRRPVRIDDDEIETRLTVALCLIIPRALDPRACDHIETAGRVRLRGPVTRSDEHDGRATLREVGCALRVARHADEDHRGSYGRSPCWTKSKRLWLRT